jgi:hypothetical protein
MKMMKIRTLEDVTANNRIGNAIQTNENPNKMSVLSPSRDNLDWDT